METKPRNTETRTDSTSRSLSGTALALAIVGLLLIGFIAYFVFNGQPRSTSTTSTTNITTTNPPSTTVTPPVVEQPSAPALPGNSGEAATSGSGDTSELNNPIVLDSENASEPLNSDSETSSSSSR